MSLKEDQKSTHQKVKQMVDEKGIQYIDISTIYNEESFLRDESTKACFITTLIEPLFGKAISVYTDAETLELLYVRTGVMRFTEIDQFFGSSDEE